MREAGSIRHMRADKGKGAPLVEGGNQYHAGTLAHFELLMDRKLLATRNKELAPKILAEVAKLPSDASAATRDAFGKLLVELNPATDRMTRRVADWLERGDNEPVDETNLERMKAFALPDEGVSKESRDE
jgi:hypothetical protein